MLLVKTYIGKSKISGIGLFAAEPIRKGQAIWKWGGNDMFYLYLQVDKYVDPKRKKEIMHYAYTDANCYKMCGDDAKYMNHSFTPNTESFNT